MTGQQNVSKKYDYDVLDFPKMRHVIVGVVQIINRNTHVHKALELGLVLEGDAVVRVNDKKFDIHTGSMFFFNANEAHQIQATSRTGVRIAYLEVADSFCGEYCPCFRNLEIPENNISSILPPEELKKLTKLMIKTMIDYMVEYSDLYALRCIGNICRLYSKLLSLVPYQHKEDPTSLARGKKMARLSRITEYIENHYSEKITLGQLAEMEGVSTTYLSHFIHEHLRTTFQEYISSVRFEHALKLLRDTSMSKTDICIVCGFSDVKYLSRMMEEHFSKPARECYNDLRKEVALSEDTNQEQTYVSEKAGRDWLIEFWNKYISPGHSQNQV